MHITLNVDLVRWLDANRDDKSRQAYIVALLKEIMQDTLSNEGSHTKGKHDAIHIRNGANYAPEQD